MYGLNASNGKVKAPSANYVTTKRKCHIKITINNVAAEKSAKISYQSFYQIYAWLLAKLS